MSRYIVTIRVPVTAEDHVGAAIGAAREILVGRGLHDVSVIQEGHTMSQPVELSPENIASARS